MRSMASEFDDGVRRPEVENELALVVSGALQSALFGVEEHLEVAQALGISRRRRNDDGRGGPRRRALGC